MAKRENHEPEKTMALQVWQQYDAMRKRIMARRDISQEERQTMLNGIRSDYNRAIEEIRGDVRHSAERRLGELPGRIKSAQEAKSRELGKILPVEVRYRLCERWAEKLSPGELPRFIELSPDNFERAALLELAELKLYGMDQAEAAPIRAKLAAVEAQTPWGASLAKYVGEVKELTEDLPAFLKALDIQERREVFAAGIETSELNLPDSACTEF